MIFPGVYIRINFTRGSGSDIVYLAALYFVRLFFVFLCRLELFICSRICLHGTSSTAKHHIKNAHALADYVSSAASFALLNFVQLKYDTNGSLLFSL